MTPVSNNKQELHLYNYKALYNTFNNKEKYIQIKYPGHEPACTIMHIEINTDKYQMIFYTKLSANII